MENFATLNILIIGGSGFLSGTLSRLALKQNHRVWAVTRGQRPLPSGVTTLQADRKDPAAFDQAVKEAGIQWDMVVDCIAFDPADIRQDIAVFRDKARHLVFISTDFVFDPDRRQFPQGEESPSYLTEGYGGKKRQAELELIQADTSPLVWTILRPCHIYGPGSQLGCLPEHGRDPKLIQRIQSGEPLRLVGGGTYLQQPILARDLSEAILSCAGNPNTYMQLFNIAGPEMVESVQYYRIIARLLGTELKVEEIPVAEYRAAHPDAAPYLCHRIYDLSKLKASGVKVPATPLGEGLREHVESMLNA